MELKWKNSFQEVRSGWDNYWWSTFVDGYERYTFGLPLKNNGYEFETSKVLIIQHSKQIEKHFTDWEGNKVVKKYFQSLSVEEGVELWNSVKKEVYELFLGNTNSRRASGIFDSSNKFNGWVSSHKLNELMKTQWKFEYRF